jgi:hypothetical protein
VAGGAALLVTCRSVLTRPADESAPVELDADHGVALERDFVAAA